MDIVLLRGGVSETPFMQPTLAQSRLQAPQTLDLQSTPADFKPQMNEERHESLRPGTTGTRWVFKTSASFRTESNARQPQTATQRRRTIAAGHALSAPAPMCLPDSDRWRLALIVLALARAGSKFAPAGPCTTACGEAGSSPAVRSATAAMTSTISDRFECFPCVRYGRRQA